MLSLVRKHRICFAIAFLAALGLRALFIAKFRLLEGDFLVYGDIARNWIAHGVFGVSGENGPIPTYIRLPGYPAFLAAIWRIVGVENITAILVVQLIVDIGTCFVVADLARRVVSDRAAVIAFWLAALCPFVAVYTATPLTEILAVFFAALSLDFAVAGTDDLDAGQLRSWIGCGLALAAGILLRPDGGILLGAVGLYILFRIIAPGNQARANSFRYHSILAGLVVATLALSPLIPWTVRNWRDFHRLQPLAPRYANAPDEPINPGFQRWVKTWMLDYVSVVDVYWNLPGGNVDPNLLPTRAFDSPEERQKTEEILGKYNQSLEWTDDLDSELGKIADARIHRAPLRYYLVLPVARITDMWLRPRTDLLRTNDRWWEWRSDPSGTFWALFMAAINAFLVASAVYGLICRRELRHAGLLVLFVLLRSGFLATLENPETRYTLECFPVIIVFAAAALARSNKGSRSRFTGTLRHVPTAAQRGTLA